MRLRAWVYNMPNKQDSPSLNVADQKDKGVVNRDRYRSRNGSDYHSTGRGRFCASFVHRDERLMNSLVDLEAFCVCHPREVRPIRKGLRCLSLCFELRTSYLRFSSLFFPLLLLSRQTDPPVGHPGLIPGMTARVTHPVLVP